MTSIGNFFRSLFKSDRAATKIKALERAAQRDLNLAESKAKKAYLQVLSDTALNEAISQKCGSWNTVLDIDRAYHEAASERMKDAAHAEPERSYIGFIDPAPHLIETLAAQMSLQADQVLNSVLDELKARRTSIVTKFSQKAGDVDAVEAKDYQSQISAAKNGLLESISASHFADDLESSSRHAETVRAEKIEAIYRQTLRNHEEKFEKDEKPGIAEAVELHQTNPAAIQRIMFSGKSVPHARMGEAYLAKDQHLLDQIVNKWTLVADYNADTLSPLSYRLAKFSEGGAFEFEKRWFWTAKNQDAKLREAAPAGEVPATMIFVDQLSLGEMVSDTSVFEKSFVFSSDRDRESIVAVKAEAASFASLARGHLLPEEQRIIAKIDGVTDYAGLVLISAWLKQNDRAKLTFRVDADGRVVVIVDRGLDQNNTPECTRDDVNMIRLLALCVVGTVSRAFNIGGTGRTFPDAPVDGGALHVPSTCVWPMEVAGSAPTDKNSLKSWWDSVPKLVTERTWAVGTLPRLSSRMSLETTLLARFAQTAERHISVMRGNGAVEKSREGSSISAALSRVDHHFFWSALALVLVWFAAVLLSLFDLNQLSGGSDAGWSFSKLELWWITLLFFAICVWRICAAFCLLSAADADSVHKKSGRRIKINLLKLAYVSRFGMYVGPGFLALCLLVALLDFFNPLSGLNELFREAPSGAKQASYRDAITLGVWALPVLGIGLLNQTRMMLKRLVTERGTITRKLSVLKSVDGLVATGVRLENGLLARTEKGGPSPFSTISELKKTLRNTLNEQWERSKRQFDSGSAANATIVALVGLLQPFANMQPDDKASEKNLVKQKLAAFLQNGSTIDAPLSQQAKPVRFAGLKTFSDAAQTQTKEAQTVEPLNARRCAMQLGLDPKVLDFNRSADQMLWTLGIMDCMDRSVTGVNAAVVDQLSQIHATLDQIRKKPNPAPGGQTVYNANVCLFPIGKYCVQEPVLALGDGQLASLTGDLETVNGELRKLASMLSAVSGSRTVSFKAETEDFYRAISPVMDKLAEIPRRHEVSVTANAEHAFEELGLLAQKLDHILGERTLQMRANATYLYAELDRVASRLTQATGRRTVVVDADTDGFYRAVSPVMTTLQHLPKQYDLTLNAHTEEAYREIGFLRRTIDRLPNEKEFTVRANAEDVFREVRFALELIEELPEHHHMANPALVEQLTRSMLKLMAWLETPPTSNDVSIGPLVTSPLLDLNLAIEVNPDSGAGQPSFQGCELIARQGFEIGSTTVRKDQWTVYDKTLRRTKRASVADVLAAFKRSSDKADPNRRYYVLGLADGSGRKLQNERLAKARARKVVQNLNETLGLPNVLVPLSLGSAGWVAGMPRPLGEIDPIHRSATIFGCDPDDGPEIARKVDVDRTLGEVKN